MTTDDQIRDKKLQYDINREAAKISALSSGKIRKYEYLTGEDILPWNFRTIRTFHRDIYEGKITLEEANEDQSSLLNEILNFKNKARPQNEKKKQEKEIFLKNLRNFFDGREKVLNTFASKIFLIKSGILDTDRSKL